MLTSIVIGSILLHFLLGAAFAKWKVKEYLDLTPTNKLPLYKRIWRILLFPVSSFDEDWGAKIEEGKYKGKFRSTQSCSFIFRDNDYLGCAHSEICNCGVYSSRFRNQKGTRLHRSMTNYQISSAIFGGLFHIIPFITGTVVILVITLYIVIAKIGLCLFSNPLNFLKMPDSIGIEKEKQISDQRIANLRQFRDKNIAEQRGRLEELLYKTQIAVDALQDLVQNWHKHIEAVESKSKKPDLDILKSMVEKLDVVLHEKSKDTENIRKAIGCLDDKRDELDTIIRRAELYLKTAALLPGINGNGRPIIDQIEENMVAANEAVEFCRQFTEIELEVGSRIDLTPETLAKSWAECMANEDELTNNKTPLSQ